MLKITYFQSADLTSEYQCSLWKIEHKGKLIRCDMDQKRVEWHAAQSLFNHSQEISLYLPSESVNFLRFPSEFKIEIS